MAPSGSHRPFSFDGDDFSTDGEAALFCRRGPGEGEERQSRSHQRQMSSPPPPPPPPKSHLRPVARSPSPQLRPAVQGPSAARIASPGVTSAATAPASRTPLMVTTTAASRTPLSSATTAYRPPRCGGYQVSNPAARLPDFAGSRSRTPSPPPLYSSPFGGPQMPRGEMMRPSSPPRYVPLTHAAATLTSSSPSPTRRLLDDVSPAGSQQSARPRPSYGRAQQQQQQQQQDEPSPQAQWRRHGERSYQIPVTQALARKPLPPPTAAPAPAMLMTRGAMPSATAQIQSIVPPPPPPHGRPTSSASWSSRGSAVPSPSPYRDALNGSPNRGPARYGSGRPGSGDNRGTPSPLRCFADDPFATRNSSPLPSVGQHAPMYGGVYADSSSANFRGSTLELGDAGYLNFDDLADDGEDDGGDPFISPKNNRGKRPSSKAAFNVGFVAAGVPGIAAATVTGFRAPAMSGFRAPTALDQSKEYAAISSESGTKQEKSAWLVGDKLNSSKRLKWAVAGVVVFVIVAAVIGGVAGAVASKRREAAASTTSSTTTTSSSSGNTPSSTTLTLQSPEIQGLLGNPDLHKVFPGIDYTPQNAQYPACLEEPPSLDNITQDVAVLSQLTPVIRLYGTDCNQTELVLQAIDALQLNDSVKLWAGVWLDTNATTNARQLAQMYSILEKYGASPFLGIIVGNEVLFREDMTEAQLAAQIDAVRTNVTAMDLDGLKVATSDLGSLWTAALAEVVDAVMANIHPFFGGVPAADAAAWTWEFWQTNDVPLTKGLAGDKQQVIAETGWPSGGGEDCTDGAGASVNCTSTASGAVAGITELNGYLSGWVCDALANGTEYFWFEAFDEPWKAVYNTPTQQWEDKWGLMYVNRTLKPGVTIPDCGGAVATLPAS